MLHTPILYSFRRCPYCMRAHMALKYAGLKVILRDVELSDLPAEALAVSAHATVPSLVISENYFMDESWDIVKWATQKNDPENWLGAGNEYLHDAEMLVETNDFSFKIDLDHYKYADRHPEFSMEHYRNEGEVFLLELEERLTASTYLSADCITISDMAIFPFIRQFAHVDKTWFDASPYPKLQRWLQYWLESELFSSIMINVPVWSEGDEAVVF